MVPGFPERVPLRARIAFGVLIVGFVVQLGFRTLVAEPYPGLFGPAFGRQQDRGGFVEAYVPAFEITTASGSQRPVTVEDLLSDFRSPSPEALELFFRTPVATRHDVNEWLCGRLLALGYRDPERFVASVRRTRATIPRGRVLSSPVVGVVTFDRPCSR